jgi:hypothetical protein
MSIYKRIHVFVCNDDNGFAFLTKLLLLGSHYLSPIHDFWVARRSKFVVAHPIQCAVFCG